MSSILTPADPGLVEPPMASEGNGPVQPLLERVTPDRMYATTAECRRRAQEIGERDRAAEARKFLAVSVVEEQPINPPVCMIAKIAACSGGSEEGARRRLQQEGEARIETLKRVSPENYKAVEMDRRLKHDAESR